MPFQSHPCLPLHLHLFQLAWNQPRHVLLLAIEEGLPHQPTPSASRSILQPISSLHFSRSSLLLPAPESCVKASTPALPCVMGCNRTVTKPQTSYSAGSVVTSSLVVLPVLQSCLSEKNKSTRCWEYAQCEQRSLTAGTQPCFGTCTHGRALPQQAGISPVALAAPTC